MHFLKHFSLIRSQFFKGFLTLNLLQIHISDNRTDMIRIRNPDIYKQYCGAVIFRLEPVPLQRGGSDSSSNYRKSNKIGQPFNL